MNTKLLKQKILDLAIRGKLTQQLKSDGTAKDLLTQISDDRRKTRDERKGTRSKKSGVILSEAQSAKSKDLGQIIPLDKSEAPFEIPANWEWVRLGDLCLFLNGYAFDSKTFQTEGIPIVRISNIDQGTIDLSNCVYSVDELNSNFEVVKGDLLIAMSGATTGKMGVYGYTQKAYLNQRVGNIKIKDKNLLTQGYRDLYLQSQGDAILAQAYGGAQPNISSKAICEMFFPLPPLAEQQRIVEKIQEAFAEIDSIENNKEFLKTHIKQARQKILDLAIHGKLVPQNKTDGTARELLSVILSEAQSAKSKDLKKVDAKATRDNPHYEKLTDVPFEIPDSWEWVKLGDVAYIASGSTPSKEAFVDNGIPYLKMYNLRNQQIDFEYKPQYVKREIHEGKLARSKAKPGDVIMNIVGPPLGKVALVPESLPECNFNQAAVLIRALYSSNLMNQYIRYFLLQMDEINAVNTKGTAGQENISLTQTQKMRFPLPPLAEQKRIVDKIEEIFASLDEISLHLV